MVTHLIDLCLRVSVTSGFALIGWALAHGWM